MSWAMRKPFAADGVDEAAGKLVARREPHRVNDDVEPVPVLAERLEGRGDFRVLGDVHRAGEAAAQLFRHGLHARLELFALVSEGELRALAAHGLGDAPGDRTLAGETDDQRALAVQESHGVLLNRPIGR
jgi:hypothetical protein